MKVSKTENVEYLALIKPEINDHTDF